MIKWLYDKAFSALHVVPGDTIKFTYTDPANDIVEEYTHNVDRLCVVNRMKVGRLTNELGFKDGFVFVVGEICDDE